jgi:subtilase family serine protease
MTRLSPLSIAMPLLLAVVVPMNAQAPDPRPIIARPSIQTAKLEANSNIPNGILPAQYKAAYGFNRIPNQGQGQTIALVDAYDDPNISSDLAFYANYFHLTPCNFQKVKVGNPAQGEDWDLVESWDVEQACAIAPQANIILVEANSDSLADLFQAVAVASAAPYNATVVSMSWMTDEFAGEQQFDSYLCNIVDGNGQPVTFVAANNFVKYPAASPCVVAAGQTTVTLSTVLPLASPLQLNYGSESAWGYGGISLYESQPSWQNPACSGFSATNRCLPDVAANAENVPVYDTYSYAGWVEVDAPGLSPPAWSAFFTLVNSGRAGQRKNTLSQAAADMYAIYYSSDYLTDFHDIVSGSGAGPGYDLATGIGSYQANALFSALVADVN